MNNYSTRHTLNSILFHLWITLLSVTVCACSHADMPDNLEPELIICEATGITRTSSTVSVKIENHGSATLSYIRFCYGEEGKTVSFTEDLKADTGIVDYELKGLKPGATYCYYAEGGTNSATLRSETLRFTTIPNERPRVSKAKSLSTGPTGIIIEFEIEDDGGEDILEAGCEVTDIQSQSTRRVLLKGDKIPEGKHLIYITGLSLRTSYEISPFAANSSGEAKGEAFEYTTRNGIILHKAGALALLFGDTPVTLKALTISGDMNGSDFRFLRYLTGAPLLSGENPVSSSVEELFLSDVNIVEGGESYDGSRYTENNIITTRMFSGCSKLKSVILPNSTTEIKRDAFASCPVLESFNVPYEVSKLSPSSECPSLKSIHVSEANGHFSDIDGVAFNKDATDIIWFPLGKTGHFTLPSSLTSIGENAFAGTHITSLEIPSSVTSIHRGAFYGSSLEEIRLPDNLKNISEGMFQNCVSLHTVRLGASTEFIGNYAFDGTSLTSLYVAAQLPPYVSSDAFTNNTLSLFENCALYVPQECKSLYRNHLKWKQFSHISEYEIIR